LTLLGSGSKGLIFSASEFSAEKNSAGLCGKLCVTLRLKKQAINGSDPLPIIIEKIEKKQNSIPEGMTLSVEQRTDTDAGKIRKD